MLITLKQDEIVTALRLYVTTNGINLNGKTLGVAFTAGRKESGLSAEISIEEDGSAALDPVQPMASALTGLVPIAAAIAADRQVDVGTVVDATPEVVTPGTSLFGS